MTKGLSSSLDKFSPDDLEEQLNNLEYGKIDNLNFDILRHSIVLDFKIYVSTNNFEIFKLAFLNVSSFYFVEDSGSDRFKLRIPDPGDYEEFTSISYYRNGIGKISIQSSDDFLTWYSSANFAIEIWNSLLFIECKSISINGKVFEVGYPMLAEDK